VYKKIDLREKDTPFKSYLSYHLVYRNDYENLNKLVFRENTSSLFKQMFEPDRDYELNNLFQILTANAFKKKSRKLAFNAKS